MSDDCGFFFFKSCFHQWNIVARFWFYPSWVSFLARVFTFVLLPLVEWVVISELLLYGICDPPLPHANIPTLAPSDLPES